MAPPNLIVIGAMKCGTSAVHRYLDRHPDAAMAAAKELNFFIEAAPGNWHRGLDWYRAQFPPAPVRGESSPGYTSPAFDGVAERMARVLPAVRLLYMVRDPIERAVSQYCHHVADGTEPRRLDEALLDPRSQYLARSRYHERLQPFLDRFRSDQIMVCAQEELLTDRRRTLRAIYRFAGAAEDFWCRDLERRWHVGAADEFAVDRRLRARLAAELAPDAHRLREAVKRDFPGWTV